VREEHDSVVGELGHAHHRSIHPFGGSPPAFLGLEPIWTEKVPIVEM
jgi:hypothetical protein